VALSDDHTKIANLNNSFNKLKEEFDRAVDVEALKLARKNGDLGYYWSDVDVC